MPISSLINAFKLFFRHIAVNLIQIKDVDLPRICLLLPRHMGPHQ